MRNYHCKGFIMIEACIALLCTVLIVLLIQKVLFTYTRLKQLPNSSPNKQEELLEIYES